MWLLMSVLSDLVAVLLKRRGLIAFISDLALSVCPFWFGGRLAGEERAGCLAFNVVPSRCHCCFDGRLTRQERAGCLVF